MFLTTGVKIKKFIPTVSHWIWCVINILFIHLFITATPVWTVWKVSLSSAVKWKYEIYVLKFGLRAIGCIVTHYSLLHQTLCFSFLFTFLYFWFLFLELKRICCVDVLFFLFFNVNSELHKEKLEKSFSDRNHFLWFLSYSMCSVLGKTGTYVQFALKGRRLKEKTEVQSLLWSVAYVICHGAHHGVCVCLCVCHHWKEEVCYTVVQLL